MDSVFWLLGVSILLLVVVLYIVLRLLFSSRSGGNDAHTARLQDLHEMIDRRLHQNMDSVNKQMHRQFESSKKLIESITKELTEVKATGREMLSFTEQLQALEQALKNPQRRGAIGEYVLEQVIGNVLPPDSYATQYTFKSGVRADAVVFLRDEKKICIDAKFSLDNYTKLLSGEVDDPEVVERRLKEDIGLRIQETAKYILPKEGTLDYAFMFLPSEALYYDLLTQKIGSGDGAENMLERAFNRYRVIIVSPTTLLAYLQTVNLGLRSLKVEEHAHEIMKQVETLRKHLDQHAKALHGVGRALGTAVNQYNKVETQYDLIDKDVFKITGKGGEYTRELLNRPHSVESDG